ncbi:MAG: hypothetical protein IJ110_01480 [Lachnospiraceae bacterium]|nr:hypothetical protein [Lachnospiraceae bacterium]
MIRIDKTVAKAALKLSPDGYQTEILYDPDTHELYVGSLADHKQRKASVKINVDPADVPYCFERLAEKGFVKKQDFYTGSCITVLPKLRHRFAFALDDFSKRYVGGFISGVLMTVAAGMILHYVIGI